VAGRHFKARVLDLLRDEQGRAELAPLPPRPLVNALLGALCRPEEDNVKWPAVEALGRTVARQAEDDLEAARNVVRRLMWSLNDESGAIGWGAAEAMAEILAAEPTLGREFSANLVSLLGRDSDSPDFLPLVQGALWAVARLAQAEPDLTARAGQHLARFFRSPEPRIRALAAWTAGQVRAQEVREDLARLVSDQAPVRLRLFGPAQMTTVGTLAGQALRSIEARG